MLTRFLNGLRNILSPRRRNFEQGKVNYSRPLDIRTTKITDGEGKERAVLVLPGYVDVGWKSEWTCGEDGELLGKVMTSKTQNSSKLKATIDLLGPSGPESWNYKGEINSDLLPDGWGTFNHEDYLTISGKWDDGILVEGSIYLDDLEYQGKFQNGIPSGGKIFKRGLSTMLDSNKNLISIEEIADFNTALELKIGEDYSDGSSLLMNWQVKLVSKISMLNSRIQELENEEILTIVEQPETEVLEFKSSVWAQYNNKTGETINEQTTKSLALEDSIIKTIAAFLNTQGGKLIIGVQDRPERKVVGIEADFQYSGNSKDIESFQNSLTNVIKAATNDPVIVGTYVEISIESIEGKSICVIDVKQKAPKSWTYVNMKNWKNKGEKKECFFVRSGPSSNIIDSRKSADEWKSARMEMQQNEGN